MSTIFTSSYARTGVLPDAGRRPQIDDRQPRATISPIGLALQDDDTIEFQRLADGGYDTERCYLPWCAEDYRSVVDYADDAHQHSGAEKRIETGIPGYDGVLTETDVIRLSIEQSDNDSEGDPEHITGEAHVFLAIGERGGRDGAYVLLTAEKLLELGNMAIAQAQIIFATRGLVNPNRVTAEELRHGEEALDARLAEYKARGEAKAAAKKAEYDARMATVKVTWHWRIQFAIGRRFALSWVGRRFPRIVTKAAHGRFEPFRILQLGASMGLIKGRRLHETDDGRRQLTALRDQIAADLDSDES